MPSLSTTPFATSVFQSTTAANLIIGTCMLSATYGQVMSADLTRIGDSREVKDCRNRLRAFLVENAGYEYNFEALMSDDITAPEMLTTVTFPYVAVTGIIIPGGIHIKWAHGGERMLSIKAKSWDHMQSGVVKAYSNTTNVFVDP